MNEKTPERTPRACIKIQTEELSREPHGVSYNLLGQDIKLYESMDVLELTCCRIKKLENFNMCPHLKALILTSNYIEKIESLEDLHHLEKLELYQNSLSKIENISHLINLRVIDLSFNNIHKIENLSELKNLTDVYLSSNKITKIENLEQNTKIRLLELGCNRIRKIENLEALSNLEELWLGKNKITDMDVPSFPKLQKLSIQSNRLEMWNDQIFIHCPNLQELYLSHNRLENVPPSIAKLESLQLLDMGNNRISNVESITLAPQLVDLWLNNNNLTGRQSITPLLSLQKLTTLYLEKNPLQNELGPGYRLAVLEILPHLLQLDAASIN